MRTKHPSPNMGIDRIPFQGIYPTPILVERYAETASLEFEVGGDAALIDPLVGVVDEAVFGVAEGHVGDASLFVGDTDGGVPSDVLK